MANSIIVVAMGWIRVGWISVELMYAKPRISVLYLICKRAGLDLSRPIKDYQVGE